MLLLCFTPQSSVAAEQLCGSARQADVVWTSGAQHAQAAGKALAARRFADGNYYVFDRQDVPRSAGKPAYSISSPGGVTFNVVYQDIIANTNSGFDELGVGAVRIAAMNAVLQYVSSVLDHTGTVNIRVEISQLDGNPFDFLAAASPWFTWTPGNERFIVDDVYERIVDGIDSDPGWEDLYITVDFGFNWNSVHTATPAPEQYDLYSVLLHEITHGLNFLSLTNSSGGSLLGPGQPLSAFDNFLFSGGGVKLWDANESPAPNIANLLIGSGDGVEFRGVCAALTTNAAGGRLYSPNPWKPGSSISHWIDFGIQPQPVMSPAIGTGVRRRTFRDLDLAVLLDLGYRAHISALPGFLVINEIDYSGDGALSFIELKNISPVPLDLSGVQLVGCDGAGLAEFGAMPLSGMLEPGAYYLLATSTNSAGLTGVTFDQTWISDPQPGAPDGLFLQRIADSAILDSVSYAGSGAHPFGAPDSGNAGDDPGSALPISLARFPDGADTNGNTADFRILPATPGTRNLEPNLSPQLTTAVKSWQLFD